MNSRPQEDPNTGAGPGAAKRIPPPTLVEVVLRELREQLIQGRFEPGDPIRVDQVAAEFGISALPVREALRVLLAEGRVQYASHRGYRVTELTSQDVVEIFLMARLLEAEAIRQGVLAFDDAAAERMAGLLDKLVSPPESATVWELAELHTEFHFVPISCARLPRMEAELRRLWDHTDHYRSLYLFHDPEILRVMHEEHRQILDACVAGEADRAVELMELHRQHALAHALGKAAKSESDSGRSQR